jgi:hypothetical protein
MGLIIKSTENKKITIQGTAIEVPEVYGRLEFAGRADGKTLEVAIANYASKEAFDGGASSLPCDVPNGNFTVELQSGEMQSIETAHSYSQKAFIDLGYDVVIDL